MSVVVITPPGPVVSWEEAKVHLRLDSEEEQTYVDALVAAATAWIDGPAGWLGRCLGPQLLEWRLSEWPCQNHQLPIGPELEVLSVTYIDAVGVEQSWPFPTPMYFDNLPAVRGREGDIRIRYWAGYGKRDEQDADKWGAQVPAPIKQAILLMVGQWFRTRENVVTGTIATAVPFSVEALLAPYRVWR